MKDKKKIIIAAVLLALLIAGALFAWKTLTPGTSKGTKTISVLVKHLDGSEKTFTVKTDAEYLRGALEPDGIIAGEEQAYGLWVQTVDGETADDSLQQWWGYDVNGETALYGVDSQPLSDGDKIVFTLNEGY